MGLHNYTTNEIIELAEKYSGDKKKKNEVIEQILKDVRLANENEFNITEIHKNYNLKALKIGFDTNSSYGIRLLEKADSACRGKSYVQQLTNINDKHIKRVMNNSTVDINNHNLIHL